MAKRKPKIEVTLDENLAKITVKMKHAELITARVLQRVIRQIQRQRKIELKQLIYKVKLSREAYALKFGKGDTDDAIKRRGTEKVGRTVQVDSDDNRDVSDLAEQISREL